MGVTTQGVINLTVQFFLQSILLIWIAITAEEATCLIDCRTHFRCANER